ncbi:O-antigen ligase-like membrane protein [Flavobacterium croceum DSM 17960]|uniref:O-antigen ligase-like membrane protein n=1 Tax=Flavobacterium croceum DSM 17960 TaxID=1121886 RepID=A0A2S4NBA3_9FLAO|nr:O-antigen ligase family protein [Flavobacterium croceum]POS02979.1 O-antigen ligase-like membrane protein [Flavobacterium croceum DSM 17960]
MERINNLKFLELLFLSTALFILLPNKIKEIPFLLFSITHLMCYGYKNIKMKYFSLLIFFFLVNLVSLFYSDDLKYGLRRIEGFLPFIYLAIPYSTQNFKNINITKWSKIFNICNAIFLLIFVFYCFISSDHLSYNIIRTSFEKLPLINIHPIYLSIIAFIGFITSLFYLKNTISILSIISNLIIIMLTGAKSTLIFLIIIIPFVFFNKKIEKIKKIMFFLLIIFFASLLIFTKNGHRERFREMFLAVSYNQFNTNNSTSVRNAVYKCTLDRLEKTNLFFGNGIGDSQYFLDQCFKISHSDLLGYNTHNQYLGIVISTGFFGLFSFFLLIFYVFLLNQYKGFTPFLIVISFFLYFFLFENVLERKNGILLFLFSIYFIFNKKVYQSSKY